MSARFVVVCKIARQNIEFVNGPLTGASHRGSGTVNVLQGFLAGATTWGIAKFQVGSWAISEATGSGLITDNYGHRIRTGHRGTGGSITNDYSLFIDTPSHAMPVANHYGI